MRGLRALAWLACLGASAGQFMTIPPHKAAKRDAFNAKKTAREAAADMINSRLATQTTRPVFEHGRRLQQDYCDGVIPGTFTADDETIYVAVKLWFDDRCKAIEKHGHISTWETGGVTDMSYLFCAASWLSSSCNTAAETFNEDIGAWDTSGATTMYAMFWQAWSFNQPIGDWRVDQVTKMNSMFYYASAFNQPLNGWRTDQVTDMSSMFFFASAFNQPIGDWRVDSVTTMFAMFRDASAFNQALGWCVADDVLDRAFDDTKCEALSCGVVQGACPDPGGEMGEYCKLSDPKLCSGSSVSFVEAPGNLFASIIENRYAVPTLADMDGNNETDLLVGREDGTLVFYNNTGSEFQHVVDDSDPFKSIAVVGRAAPALVDLDGDGNFDLVVGAADGTLMYYRNEGSMVFRRVTATEAPTTSAPTSIPTVTLAPASPRPTNTPTLTARRLSHQDADHDPFVSINVGAHAAPAFADIDGDGLVDLVIGKETSGALTYYKNVGSRTAAKFESVSDDPFANIIVGSFSKPTFYDIDNDGDRDLIVGDNIGDVLLYLNVGSSYAPSFSVVEGMFAGITPVYAAPTFGVLNGVPSLVVGSAPGQLVVYGETPAAAEFVTTRISPFSGIDIGDGSKPSFVDLDYDGDLDLVVGEEDGTLNYYHNLGTPSRPSFEQVVENSPFDGIDVGYLSAPTFVDLDNDGDKDLVVGDALVLNYYRNVGTPSQSVFQKVGFSESPFGGIDVRENSMPTFADLNNDGLLDLVVGEDLGTLRYYRNVGTPSQPSFEKVQDCSPLAGSYSYSYEVEDDDGVERRLLARSYSYSYLYSYSYEDEDDDGVARRLRARQLLQGPPLNAYLEEENPFCGINVGDYSTPSFADIDNDGLLDLVVGENSGKLFYYRNMGTPSQPAFEKVEEDSPFDAIDVGSWSAPTFADIDDDGDLDLIVGGADGRLNYFQSDSSCIKTSEAGACSGNGICLAQEATCACTTIYAGAQCDECAAGSHGLDCVACPYPTWSKQGVGQTCDECQEGFYENERSCEECGQNSVCPPGTTIETFTCVAKSYRVGNVCKDCTEGMICDSAGTTAENLVCLKDYYRDTSLCKPCKDGMVCDEPGVTLENVRLKKQHWRTSSNSDKIETCPLKKSCRSTKPRPDTNVSAADGGRVARRLNAAEPANATDAGEALCEEGHEGPLCAVCKKHYYRMGPECVRCRPSTPIFTVIGLIVGIIIFGAFFLFAMNYSNVVGKVVEEAHKSGKSEADESVGETFGRQGSVRYARGNSTSSFGLGAEAVGSAVEGEASEGVERTIDEQNLSWWPKARRRLQKAAATDALRRNVTTFVKQLSGTYSILVSIPWIFDIKFPDLYEKVLERLALVNVNMSFSLECVVSRKVTYQDRLLAATIGPIVAILLVIGLGMLYLGFKRNEHEHRKDRRRTTTLVIAQLVLLIMFLSYTTTSTTIFRAFRPCDRFDEKYHGSDRYMHDDYSVSCNSNRYTFILVYAALMTLVYPIGIPLASFVVMWRNREKLDPKLDPDFLQKDRKFEAVGESDSAFRRARVEQKTELRTEAIQPKDDELFSFAQLYHFMYDNYEPDYWWFECFDYVRRLALTGLMVIIAPGTALQGFVGVLIALGGLLSYNTFNPFVEDASDRLAMGAQLATFFVFLSALMVQVDAVYHRSGFAVLLVVVTFVPPLISLCSAFHAFHGAMKQMEPDSSKAATSAKDDTNHESSPTSPHAHNAPPQDEEQPAATETD